MRSLIFGCVFTLAGTAVAGAGELWPLQARSIALGSFHGVAYYTVESNGLRFVATVAPDGKTPLRMISILAPGQSVILAIPAAEGASESLIEFKRMGDILQVSEPGAPSH